MLNTRAGQLRDQRTISKWICIGLTLLGIGIPWSAAAADCPYGDHLSLGPSESTLDGVAVYQACATITLENGYTVGPSGQVRLEAMEKVVFRPGVRVEQGGRMAVRVGDVGLTETQTVTTSAGPGGSIQPASLIVPDGAPAEFTVIPEIGYRIDQVTGCGGILVHDRYLIGAVTGSCTVSATFALNQYTLTYTADPNGWIIGETTQIVSHGGAGETVFASPDTGFSFLRWSDDSTANPRGDINVAGDVSVTASFVPVVYNVTTAAGTGGSISPPSQIVQHGFNATFTVTPNTGYHITAVSGCGGSLDGTEYTTGAITGACTVSASFSLNSYTVSASAGTGGGISPGSATVTHGAKTTFTITPATGYAIDMVSGCAGTLSGTTYNTGAITGVCTVEASFLANAYTVSATAGTGGDISPASQAVNHGATTTFTVSPDTGYSIDTVSGCDGSLDGTTYTTGIITGACTVEAVFGEVVYVGTSPINDTGIDWCADAANIYDTGDAAYKEQQCIAVANAGFPGQDGHHGRDAQARGGSLNKIGGGNAGFDFTKISNSGAELPITATLGSGPDEWACTSDNVTGLIWEVKVNNSAHLRHRDHLYTWYDPASPDGNPGTQNGGTCTGSNCDTTGFVQAVNAQDLCGSSDWRMPTRRELQGIVDYGRFNPAIDTGYFPNTLPQGFWSGSPYAGNSNNAWSVYFYNGFANYSHLSGGYRSNDVRVRLVRGGQ